MAAVTENIDPNLSIASDAVSLSPAIKSRGRTGKIVAYRGAYLLADAYAKNISKHEKF